MPPTTPTPEPRFANASEATLAAILSAAGIRWRYEPDLFPLAEDADGHIRQAFRPDFHLPDYGRYVELTVMRQASTTRKHRKLRLLQARSPGTHVEIVHAREFAALVAHARATGVLPA